MNTNKNPNLPANAIPVADVTEGMTIRFPYAGDGAHKVTKVLRTGVQVVITTDKGKFRANLAGTVRKV